MTPQGQRVLRDALDLTPIDRAELIEQVLASFDRLARHDIDAAWAQEAEDRIDAYERGEIEVSPAGRVFKEFNR